jgi:hypothetical protein
MRKAFLSPIIIAMLLVSASISASVANSVKANTILSGKVIGSDDASHVVTDEPWVDWEHYHNYTEIVSTLLYLNSTYSSIVDVFSIGKSWLNRDIYCIRLTNESDTQPKPKVFFVGYHHAREPISAELPLYFAVEAATSFGTNTTITRMLNRSEIYIIVALNVDGLYLIKQNEWQRKNAHPFNEDGDGLLDEDPPEDEDGDGYIEDLFYLDAYDYHLIRWEGTDNDSDGFSGEDWLGGVDINRNYGYQWNATCDSGSPYPSAEDFRGSAPFSEPETRAIRDLALTHDFKYAVSFHSGTETIGYPWGYTYDPTPDDAIFREVGANLSALVGAPYGPNSNLYTMSGSWDDWMYGNRSTLAFTCEIYGNDTAWCYTPGPEPHTWWEGGIFQAFNPNPKDMETVVQRWCPVFTYVTERAIAEYAPNAPDIAIINVTTDRTVVGAGFTDSITVTIENQGSESGSFTVSAYCNDTPIPIHEEWPTIEQREEFWSIGDTNRDSYIGDYDLNMIATAYGSKYGDKNWNPDADLDQNLVVNAQDLQKATLHYGQDAWTHFGMSTKIEDHTLITLPGRSSTKIVFEWNTEGLAKGSYTIRAYATPHSNETDFSDNNFTNGSVLMTIPGDVELPYREVDIYDFTGICVCYDSKIGEPNYYPNYDLDGNGIIDIFDVTTCGVTYGQKDP